MINHSKPELNNKEIENVIKTIKAGKLTQGDEVKRFESLLAQYIGVKDCVAVSSGTAALHLVLIALNIASGDEVILPSYVCTAPLNAINYTGAVPVLADIGEDFNLSIRDVKKKLSKRTRAIIVTHMFGLPAEIDELLELVNLSEAKRLSLKHYSKGMLERIGLAAALINDAKILILDEPTTGLDPIGCKETRDLLLKLKEQGKTILLSSHFLSEVERVCDRIAIFHRGNLLAVGRLDALLSQYNAENLEDLFVKTIEGFDRSQLKGDKNEESMDNSSSVSYTHLTLPTKA